MSGNNFDSSVSMDLPSPSSSTFNSPMGGSQEKMATSGSNWSGNSQSETVLAETDKKVIKNGNLTLKVDDVDDAVVKIDKIAKDNGGDLFSSNFSKNSQDLKGGTLSIKVPVANFEKTFTEAKKVAAAVLRESTSGQDVTELSESLVECNLQSQRAGADLVVLQVWEEAAMVMAEYTEEVEPE